MLLLGSSYASQCNSLSAEYAKSQHFYDFNYNYPPSMQISKSSTANTFLKTQVNYTYSAIETLCDGHARVKGPVTATATTVVTITRWKSEETVMFTDLKKPPRCTIERNDCEGLWADYYRTYRQVSSAQEPQCQSACGPCQIYGGTVELLYSPLPATASRDMCATAQYGPPPSYINNMTTAMLVPYLGTTLDLRSAYISFQTAYAEDGCGRRVGSAYPGAILGMSSKDLSTLSTHSLPIPLTAAKRRPC